LVLVLKVHKVQLELLVQLELPELLALVLLVQQESQALLV
jgi:hypothetical protein